MQTSSLRTRSLGSRRDYPRDARRPRDRGRPPGVPHRHGRAHDSARGRHSRTARSRSPRAAMSVRKSSCASCIAGRDVWRRNWWALLLARAELPTSGDAHPSQRIGTSDADQRRVVACARAAESRLGYVHRDFAPGAEPEVRSGSPWRTFGAKCHLFPLSRPAAFRGTRLQMITSGLVGAAVCTSHAHEYSKVSSSLWHWRPCASWLILRTPDADTGRRCSLRNGDRVAGLFEGVEQRRRCTCASAVDDQRKLPVGDVA